MFPTEAVPEKIGNYRVLRRLSGGGGADVYLGKMEGPMGFQRQVALKLVPYDADYDPRLPEELAREASICSRLNHPAIVKVFDFFEHENRLVLVLEHIEGIDLDKLKQHLLRRNKKLHDDAIYYLVHQLAGALAHAHSATDDDGNLAPVIHRNLNPENVLIGWDGQVRITGFGLGKILGRSPESVVGTVRGMPGYMSPEQTRGERVTTRADVYALGMIAWSLLAQRHPPIDGTKPHKLAELRQDMPREIAAAIDAALEQLVDKRKITCAEIESWLEKIVSVAKGKNELRDKARLLRSKSASEAAAASVRADLHANRQTASRRRLSVKMVRPSEPPPGRPPLARKSRPPPRGPTGQSGSMRAVSPLESAAPASRSTSSMAAVSAAPPSVGPGAAVSAAPPSASGASEAPSAFDPAFANFAAPAAPTFGSPGTAPFGDPNDSSYAGPPPVAPTFGPPPSTAPSASTSTMPSTSTPSYVAPSTFGPPSAHGPLPAPPRPPGNMGVVNEATPFTLAPPQGEAAPAKPGRPLSAVETIGIATLSAVLVVAAGIYLSQRGAGTPAPAPSAPIVVVMPPQTPTSTAQTPAPPATATPSPTQSNGVTLGADGQPDTSQIEDGAAVIVVKTTIDNGYVYLNGAPVGPPNAPIKVNCGRYYVRVGSLPGSGGPPTWLSPGQSAAVPCKRVTTLEARAGIPFQHRH